MFPIEWFSFQWKCVTQNTVKLTEITKTEPENNEYSVDIQKMRDVVGKGVNCSGIISLFQSSEILSIVGKDWQSS